jgi:glucose-1-phosphate adenylyltransferase
MDYAAMVRFHWDHKGDITVAVQPVTLKEASRYGLLKRDADQRISAFIEKPRDPDVLAQFANRNDPERPYLGSMGIYLFNTKVLTELLESSTYQDFGAQIIPNALTSHAVFGFGFDGYWEDIGTIRSFYETNLLLARPESPFNFYDPVRPIYTRPRYLPGSVIDGATLTNVLLADGCQIHKARLTNCVIGNRSQIADGVRMSKTIMMGTDYYDPPGEALPDNICLGIGSNSQIEGAIIDKNVRIGEGVVIKPFPRGTEMDEESWAVQDGIVIIPKGAFLHPGTYIGPD